MGRLTPSTKSILLVSFAMFTCSPSTAQPKTFSVRRSDAHQKRLEKLIQCVIDSPVLQQFYHTDKIANRKPLIITGRFVPNYLNLRKFDKKVLIFDQKEIKKRKIDAYLDFKIIAVGKSSADIVVNYSAEGLNAKFRLVERGKVWRITRSSAVEH